MYRKLVLFVLCVTLVLTTAGCYAQVEKPEQSTSVPADTTPRDTTLPRETTQPQADGPHFAITHVEPNGTKARHNIRSGDAGYGIDVFPAPDGSSVFFPGGVIRYYDMSSHTSFVVCPIPGCTHDNPSCPSRIPGIVTFCADENYWCAFTKQDEVFSFLRIDLQTGERKVLHTWDAYWYLGEDFISSGYVFAAIRCSEKDLESYVCMDLSEGTVKEFAHNDKMGFGRLVGGGPNTAIMCWVSYSEPLLTMEEWLEANPGKSDEDYFAYTEKIWRNTTETLRRYDLTTGTYEEIEPGEDVGLFSDPNSSYDDYFVYRKGDSVMLGSITGGESRKVFTAEDISNAWLMDGRVFILRRDEEGRLQEWVADLTGGEAQLLHDYGSQVQGISFSAVKECNDYFFGSGDNGYSYILKADYYAGNFDKANSSF